VVIHSKVDVEDALDMLRCDIGFGTLIIVGCSLSVGCEADRGEIDCKANSIEVMVERDGVEDRVDGNPVTTTLQLAQARAQIGDSIALTVQFAIDPPWEIRTLDGQPAIAATRLELELPEGLRTEGDWQPSPSVRSMTPDGHAAYADNATFSRILIVGEEVQSGEQTIQCTVGYQACNDRQCLPPTEVKLNVMLRVE
jgi:hypothetical protein